MPDLIQIPGYRIERPLGRGGMSTVYLALQESVQREVALKIMSGSLLGDEEFGARFLREARIAASLRHPNVVHVYDVAQHDDQHYMAMEHLPGGAVLARRGPRRDYVFSIRAVREIASALDYAHRRGVVHRDIKPDNILLREDGSAVLTDFGIARAGDSMRMTRTGAIIGTPHYMSPEQARGQDLDGRADLYSLGVVFYQLLLGQVPYQANDSVAVGIMHITAPLPKLPESLERLQPLFDRLLAKDPARRFQSGAELIEALDAVAGFEFELPELQARSRRSAAPEGGSSSLTVVTPAELPEPRARSRDDEGPGLGAVDAVATDSKRGARGPRPRALKSRRSRQGWGGWVWALLLAAALLVPGVLYQDNLRQLWSASDRAEQLQRADLALQQGRLRDDVDGPGARSLFNAVLAAEPDHEAAREGLRRVGRAHLHAAQSAADAGNIEQARRELESARAMGVADAEASALEDLLDERSGQQARLDGQSQLIEAAQAARLAGLIEQPGEGAIALYQQALALDPGSAVARAGLRETLSPLLEAAGRAITDSEFAEAERLLAVVGQADPGNLDLPEIRGRLSEARKGRREHVLRLLAEARSRISAGHLTTPMGASAQDSFKAALALDSESNEAREGLRRLGTELLRRAETATADFDFEAAEAALDGAALLSPPPSGLRAARTRMEQAQARYSRLPIAGNADPQRVASLLADARKAISDGRVLHPPGESAFDSLRRILQLDPRNAAAQQLLDQLPGTAVEQFEAALAGSRTSLALRYVEGLQGLAPNDSRLPQMRQRLAAAFIGLANERLGRGETRSARQALERAAELEPNSLEIPALRARLEQLPEG